MGPSILQDRTRQVTVGEFREFVSKTGYLTDCERRGGGWITSAAGQWVKKPDASWDNPYTPQEEDDPVVLVSGFDAIFFANWKSLREGLVPAYTVIRAAGRCSVERNKAASGYRLPAESECDFQDGVSIDQPSPVARPQRKKSAAACRRSPSELLQWCWEDAAHGRADQQQESRLGGNGTPTLCPRDMIKRESTVPEWLKDGGPSCTASIVNFRLSRGN